MKKDEKYIVIKRSLIGNFTRKTTEIALKRHGYQRDKSGFYYLRIPNDANFDKVIKREDEWLRAYGIFGDVEDSMKQFKTERDPYDEGWLNDV